MVKILPEIKHRLLQSHHAVDTKEACPKKFTVRGSAEWRVKGAFDPSIMALRLVLN